MCTFALCVWLRGARAGLGLNELGFGSLVGFESRSLATQRPIGKRTLCKVPMHSIAHTFQYEVNRAVAQHTMAAAKKQGDCMQGDHAEKIVPKCSARQPVEPIPEASCRTCREPTESMISLYNQSQGRSSRHGSAKLMWRHSAPDEQALRGSQSLKNYFW